jgi:putative phosphoribosyl transferase
MRFRDRVDAGRHLAEVLGGADLGGLERVVLGLPRGGVPVAYEIALSMSAPLDVLVVRKLGVPFQPELAMGAIGEGGIRVENEEVLRPTGLGAADLEAAERRERVVLDKRADMYRDGRERIEVSGRCVVIVDDGIATGSSARAACRVARALGAARIVLAAPVASRMAALHLRNECDALVCLELPEPFFAVGEWYRDFSPTSDSEVVALLRRAASGTEAELDKPRGKKVLCRDDEVEIRSDDVRLSAWLAVPTDPTGIVVFAHGSGSSRLSPRNRFVATALHGVGMATLLVDLLTPEEAQVQSVVFDVDRLARRVCAASGWADEQPELKGAHLGYFGASTGAAGALSAAAQPDNRVEAVVSRGGRPDLAARRLSAVRAPTLLIVGGRDEAVVELNREAQANLRCENRLTIIPGASHLFEERGAIGAVAEAAREWFVEKFAAEKV